MRSIPERSSISIMALCCAGLVSAVIAFDPTPAGYVSPRRPQSAVLLSVAAPAELEAVLDAPHPESSLIPY